MPATEKDNEEERVARVEAMSDQLRAASHEVGKRLKHPAPSHAEPSTKREADAKASEPRARRPENPRRTPGRP
jgi:hypothetical protein